MQISYNGQEILLEITSPLQDSRSHTISIPIEKCRIETTSFGTPLASQRGWKAILDILKDQYSSTHQPLIGTSSAPVQYDLNAMLGEIHKTGAKFYPKTRKVSDGTVSVKIVGKKRQHKKEMTLEELDL